MISFEGIYASIAHCFEGDRLITTRDKRELLKLIMELACAGMNLEKRIAELEKESGGEG